MCIGSTFSASTWRFLTHIRPSLRTVNPMITTLASLALLISTLCYGAAAVLQARAVRSAQNNASLDPRFFATLIHQPLYVFALALSAVGFIAQLPALRTFPLFAVQATQAANLAVAAMLAIPVLKEHLRILDWVAVTACVGGLCLLLMSINAQHSIPAKGFGLSLLAWTAFLSVISFASQRIRGPSGGAILGFMAGLAFGTVGVAVKSAHVPSSLTSLISDPAIYVLIVSGALAFMLYAVALDRSTVTVVTTALIMAQVGGSSLVGTLMLGDRTRSGYALTATFGLALAVVGAIALARYAQPSGPPAEAD